MLINAITAVGYLEKKQKKRKSMLLSNHYAPLSPSVCILKCNAIVKLFIFLTLYLDIRM